MINITILGATGTIGINTLDVISRQPGLFQVFALTAHRNVDVLFQQCQTWRPRIAVMTDGKAAAGLRERLATAGIKTEVLAGARALAQVAAAPETDYVMAGIVGAAGLLPNLAAVAAGKRVLLANKESLVMSGRLFMQAARDSGAVVLPIDSEHNAIFQCLPPGFGDGVRTLGVRRLLLTASGGPFRTLTAAEIEHVTPQQACQHPNWVMGPKISVDSATMMNKGLEIIEACWLFNVDPSLIEVVVHPESVIHSMVEYADGSVMAQLGNPDMRTPIAYALAWPQRIESGVERLNLFAIKRLNFEPPDEKRFPCLRLAREAMQAAGTATAILNAANEVAVAGFLNGEIPFTAIPDLIAATLDAVAAGPMNSIDDVLAADGTSRAQAHQIMRARHGR